MTVTPQNRLRLEAAIGHQIVDDPLHIGCGNGKAQPLGGAVLIDNFNGVDAHHLAVLVEERAAGVAR